MRFGKCHQPGFFDKVPESNKVLDISVLFSNVHIDSIERFDQLFAEYIARTIVIICCTTNSMVDLARADKIRKRSAVINLNSMTGLHPARHYNIYSASKAYIYQQTRCMSREYNKKDFISAHPSELSTAMTNNKPINIWTLKTNRCVGWTLNDLAKGYIQTEGRWKHKGQSLLTA